MVMLLIHTILKQIKKADELTEWVEHKFKKYVYKYTNATYYIHRLKGEIIYVVFRKN